MKQDPITYEKVLSIKNNNNHIFYMVRIERATNKWALRDKLLVLFKVLHYTLKLCRAPGAMLLLLSHKCVGPASKCADITHFCERKEHCLLSIE